MAGVGVSLTVTAKDAYNNTATGYAGIVHFSSSDSAAVLPANAALTNGAGTFTATLKTAGSQTIAAADTVNGSLAGSSGTVTARRRGRAACRQRPPAHIPGRFNFTVTAQDAYNNTVTGYSGTLHFSSSDAAATLPANATLTGGTGTFSATLEVIRQPDDEGSRYRQHYIRRALAAPSRRRGGRHALCGQRHREARPRAAPSPSP